jgi:hypothetical protein
MTTLIRFSPPRAYIDPNMIDVDGLIPAAREFVTGFRRLGGFRVGQPIQAYDEDGNAYSGQIARVEPAVLHLDIIVREPISHMEPSSYLNVVHVGVAQNADPSKAAPGPDLQLDANRWVLV